jgi:adenylate kinase
MSKNLVFIGAPGSGKGTQSSKLKTDKGLNHISTGDLLRNEIASKSELGNRVKIVMDEGQLVSDDLVIELLKSNLDLTSQKYIFDGYPRNIAQAKILHEQILAGHDYTAVYFKVNTEELVTRLTNRRVTKDGKQIYNLVTNPPKVTGICDVTGDSLIQRDDDKEEVIRKRMDVFESTIGPVVEYYESLGLLETIKAENGVNEVYEEIVNFLN